MDSSVGSPPTAWRSLVDSSRRASRVHLQERERLQDVLPGPRALVTFVDANAAHAAAVGENGLSSPGFRDAIVRCPALLPERVRRPLGRVLLGASPMWTSLPPFSGCERERLVCPILRLAQESVTAPATVHR